jgi:hypothetical protein
VSISPEALDRLMKDGQARIDKLKARVRYDEDGVMLLPTPCELCEKDVIDIALITGDGVAICSRCFNGTVDALNGVPV